MSRKVLICFDFDNDLWRVNRVLNSWESARGWEVSGFCDKEDWQNLKLRGTYGLNRWFMGEMDGTSVTMVLVGSQTSRLSHVQYVLTESIKHGNGLLLIDIHNIRDPELRVGTKGLNPLDALPGGTLPAGKSLHYDWVNSDGSKNLDSWLDRVAAVR